MLAVSVVVLSLLLHTGWCQQQRGLAYSCPEKNGRFPSASQCDAYIECIDGVPEEKLCPDGLLFNPKALFTYPCQYSVDVDCEGRSGLQPAQPTDECPHQFGYYLLGDAANCGKFLNCVDGRGYEFDCPLGLAFSQQALLCDWPDQVSSCDAEAFLGFTCPSQEGVFGDEFQYFRSPHDCQKYYICVNGRPRLYACPEERAFNEDIGGCDGIENVTACYNSASRDQQFQSSPPPRQFQQQTQPPRRFQPTQPPAQFQPTQSPVQFQQQDFRRRRVQTSYSG